MDNITVIGTGDVGSLIAFSLLGEIEDLYLVDKDYKRVKSVALDLMDAVGIAKLNTRIAFSANVQAHTEAYIICIGKGGQKRDTTENTAAFIDILEEISLIADNPFIIVVTNPTGYLGEKALHTFCHVYSAGRDLDNIRVKSRSAHEMQCFDTHYRHIAEGGSSRFGIAAEIITMLRRHGL